MQPRRIERVTIIDNSDQSIIDSKKNGTDNSQPTTLYLLKTKNEDGELRIYVMSGGVENPPKEWTLLDLDDQALSLKLLLLNQLRYKRPESGSSTASDSLNEDDFVNLEKFAITKNLIRAQDYSSIAEDLFPDSGGQQNKLKTRITNFFGEDFVNSLIELGKILRKECNRDTEENELAVKFNNLMYALKDTPISPMTKDAARDDDKMAAINFRATALKNALACTSCWQKAGKWITRIISILVGLGAGATFGFFAGKAAGTSLAGPAGAAMGAPLGAIGGGLGGAWLGNEVGRKVSHFFSPAIAKADHSADLLQTVESKRSPRT